jgi:hypothetical protein
MKQLHVAKHAPEAHLVRGFLAAHGIDAEVRGEYLTSGWGELPLDVCSVWVREDRDYARARELLSEFFSGAHARRYSGEAWVCASCSEPLEGQFTQCWRCGATRA